MEETLTGRKTFAALSSFADFILKNCLEEYVRTGLRTSTRAANEEQSFEESLRESKAELQMLAEGQPLEMVRGLTEKWSNDLLPELRDEAIGIEDIAAIAQARKIALVHLIPRFTTDPGRIIALVDELDRWQLGCTTAAFGIFIDVLRNRNAELRESNANLRDFAFIASHDLKEPLRKISTLGDRLQQEREGLTAEGKAYLDKMINASLRMQRMVDDLLSLSQISDDTPFEKVSLDQLLADVLQTFESRIVAMGAEIKADRLPEAEVAPSQFRRLFQNLVGNALKFASKDRPLVLRIACTQLDKAQVSDARLRKASLYLKLTFSDNGIGFDNQFADKIFAIFHRLNARSEYDGAGIGLAICRKIVEAHGGTIQASSSLELGTDFTIIIPTSVRQNQLS